MKFQILFLSLIISSLGYTQPVVTLDTLISPACNGLSDGGIHISVSGGLMPYTFDWDNDGTNDFDDPEDLTGIGAGFYTCIVKDDNGDTDTLIVELTEPAPLNPQIVTSTASCCGADNGSLTGWCGSGTGPYIYSLDGGVTSQPTGYFNNLYPGNYCVFVTDSYGCIDSVCFTVVEEPMVVTVDVTPPTCVGGSDGTATLNITGICGTVYVDWTYNGTGDINDPIFATGLSAGTYYATIWDDGDCIAIGEAIIPDGTGVVDVVLDSTISPTCSYSSEGAIYTSVVAGIGPVTYDWDNDGTGDNDDQDDLLNIPGGSYELIVIDLQGCKDTLNVSLSAPPPIDFQYISQQDQCCSGPTGSFEVLAIDGTPGYTYSIDGFTTSQNTGHFVNLFPGLYTVEVIDTNGCTGSAFVAISDIPNVTVNLSADSSCIGSSNGNIYTQLWWGCGPFLFDWSYDGFGDLDDPQNPTNLPAGSYTLHVYEDGGNCSSASASITIYNSTQAFEVQIDSFQNNLCSYSSSGAIFSSVISSSAPYTIDWDIDGLGDADDAPNLTGLPEGTYVLVVENDSGCVDTLVQNISTESNLEVSLLFSWDNICEGDTIGQILSDVVNGVLPYLHDWDIDGLGDYDDAPNIYDLAAGTYTLVVQDSVGCTDTLVASIADGNPFTATLTAFMDSLVADQIGTYQWVECPSFIEITGETSQHYVATQNGEYAVIVENNDGCVDTTDCALVEGIGLIELNNSIKIIPNPGNGFVWIYLPQDIGTIRILDMNGKLVHEKMVKSEIEKLDVSHLPNGIYAVELQVNGHRIIEKLIISQ